VPGESSVPDGEDAAVDGEEPVDGEPMVDRAAPEPCGDELRSGDHAMLAARDGGDLGVDRSSVTFAMDIDANVTLDGHRQSVATRA
jgi:hypothetical protein